MEGKNDYGNSYSFVLLPHIDQISAFDRQEPILKPKKLCYV